MRVTKHTDRYVILDDVLPPEQFELMVEYAARNDYARNPRWIKPWDLGDEMPWQTGETVHTRGKALHADDPRKAYPTGLAIDLLIRKVLESKFYRDQVPDTYVTARCYLHPPGSGLDWHDDEGRFSMERLLATLERVGGGGVDPATGDRAEERAGHDDGRDGDQQAQAEGHAQVGAEGVDSRDRAGVRRHEAVHRREAREGRDADGRPRYVRGERAALERNVMRYYLALLAHRSVTTGAPTAAARCPGPVSLAITSADSRSSAA